MQSAAFLLCVALCGTSAFGAVVTDRVNPVTKVVSLLTDLEAKLTKNGQAEDKAYAEYKEWCDDTATNKGFEIKTAKAEIEDLTATINKADADITASASKIEELAGNIAANEADLKAATMIREKENKEFVVTETELVDVVDTLDRAINILERKMKTSALVQSKVNTQDLSKLVQSLNAVVDATALSLHDKKKLVALAQATAANNADGGDDDLGAPEPEVYKSHSENIVDVLEDLREKAESQLSEARKQETNAKHNYEMLRQSLEDQMSADTKEMNEAKATKNAAEGVKATASGDLTATQKDLADAESALEEVNGGCKTAAADHEESMKSRAEELKVLADAKEAIMGMTSSAEAATYSNATSFLQVVGGGRAGTRSQLLTRADLANFEVVNLVRNLARKYKSAALNQLATRISAVIKYGASAGEDPFAKVKALIVDLIDKLEKEAGAEASHKAYCDKEMASTQEKIDDLSQTIDGLTAQMDKKAALAAKLKGEVQELQAELAELAKSQAEMEKVRQEEHAVAVQTKADLEQGLEGVRLALKLLREYYATSSEEGALIQQQPEAPTYHEKATGAGSGIIGMLEVIETDFGKNLAQVTMEEDSAATEFEKTSQQNRVTKALKDQDVKYKTKEAESLTKAVSELSSDKSAAQTELDAVLEYSTSLRATCVLKPETYEERKGRREAEIAGLKEALAILNGEAMLLQRKQAGLRGSAIAAHF